MSEKRNGHGVPIDVPGDDVCTTCGRVDCDRKRFEDSKPEWVGGNPAHFETLAEECEEAAKDLGQRYAALWRTARVMVRSMELYSGEATALRHLAAIVYK